MKKWLAAIGLLLMSTSIWADVLPFRQQALSPNKQWLATIEKAGDQRQIYLTDQRTQSKRLLTLFGPNDGGSGMGDAFGVYDICWSPDSRLIFFVFQAHHSSTISHVCDSFGVIDIQTAEYDWVAGFMVDGMELEFYGERHPNFNLAWPDNNHVSYDSPKAALAKLIGDQYRTVKTKPAGRRTISVSQLRQQFVEDPERAKAFARRLCQIMHYPDWRRRVVPLLPPNQREAQEVIEGLAHYRPLLLNMKHIEIMQGYNSLPPRGFQIAIWTDRYCMQAIVSKQKVVHLLLD